MEVEKQNGRAKWIWGVVILGVIAGFVLQLGGPWTTQRVLAGALGLLREIWTAPFILGLIGLANTTVSWWRGSRVATWPTVAGVVTKARVHKGKSWTDMGTSGTGAVTVYRPQIVYSYEVAGVRLQRTRVQFGASWHEQVKSKAEHAIAPYPVGQAVLVRYNPQRPSESALEPGVAPLWRASVIFSLALFALGACGWLATFAAG